MNNFQRMRKSWISSAHRGFADENTVQNTLKAYRLAAEKGADMIETDARTTKDGVLIANHDADVKGFGKNGNSVSCIVSETDYSFIKNILLKPGGDCEDTVPTLRETLSLAYYTGMCVNIDLKEGSAHAEDIANLVCECGMRGRVVYATNGSGAETIKKVLAIDPDARFIDTKQNFTKENLAEIENYRSKCYVYTWDFSDENIAEIRKSGCMLAAISLNAENAPSAFRHHPDMAEYPHTSDFEQIDRDIISAACLSAKPSCSDIGAAEKSIADKADAETAAEAIDESFLIDEEAEAHYRTSETAYTENTVPEETSYVEKTADEQIRCDTEACEYCAAAEEQPEYIFCTECGKKLPSDSVFCSECGKKVN